MVETRRRVLWADDNESRLSTESEYLKQYLRSEGIEAEVEFAADGNEAFRKASSGAAFDAIVVDLDLPGFPGLDAVRALIERGLGARTIIVSGMLQYADYRDAAVRLAADIAGVFDIDNRKGWSEAIRSLLGRSTVNLLHLSDAHFGVRHAFRNPGEKRSRKPTLAESIEPLLRRVMQNLPPDLVVVTGDMTSEGAFHEFGQALDFFDWVGTHLKLARSSFVFTPGNHDVYRPMEQGRRFDRYLEFLRNFFVAAPMCMPRVARGGGETRSAAEVIDLRVEHSLGLVIGALNSVVDDGAHWDTGRIDESQLLGVEGQLDDLRDVERDFLRIAAFHHPLFPVPLGRADDEEPTLGNGGLVGRSLSGMGFRVVLHGHTHYPALYIHHARYVHRCPGEEYRSMLVGAAGSLGGAHANPAQPALSFSVVSITREGLVGDSARVLFHPYVLPGDQSGWRALPPLTSTI